jgi:hypothetical protein
MSKKSLPCLASPINRNALEAHAREDLLNGLKNFSPESASIMVEFVLSYADRRKPSIVLLYMAYRRQVKLYNEACPQDQAIRVLSKYLFRSSVERLERAFVLAARHGSRSPRAEIRRQPI